MCDRSGDSSGDSSGDDSGVTVMARVTYSAPATDETNESHPRARPILTLATNLREHFLKKTHIV